MNNRLDHIDMARGLAMTLVVVGHSCSSNTGDLNRMILSFHMPLFFLLSGIFAKEYTWHTILGGVKNKARRILIPQLLLAVLVNIMVAVPAVVLRGASLEDHHWLYALGYWFLPTLFLTSVIHMILTCFINMRKRANLIIVLLATAIVIWIVLCVFDISNGFFSQFLKLVPVAYAFYLLGVIFKEQCMEVKSGDKLVGILLLVSVIALFVVSQWNKPVLMALSDYGFFPLFVVTSLLGTFVVIETMKCMKKIDFLVEIGRMSIAVYVWNFIVVVFTKGIVLRVLHLTGLYTSGVLAAITFVISILLLFFISKLTLKYTPCVYGVEKKY